MAGGEPGRLVLITGVAGTGKSSLAEAAADILGAAVLGWDWAMASLNGSSRSSAVSGAM